MAGYSDTPLERKLGIKDDDDLVFLDHPPAGFDLDAATTIRLRKHLRISLSFHTEHKTLAKRFPELAERTVDDGMIWVCWPKKTARKLGYTTDLDENVVRGIGLAAGMVDVKVAAIDEVWSGLKFVRRLADRS